MPNKDHRVADLWSSPAGATPVCMKFRILEKVRDQMQINIVGEIYSSV